jgi:hypothetical protein
MRSLYLQTGLQIALSSYGSTFSSFMVIKSVLKMLISFRNYLFKMWKFWELGQFYVVHEFSIALFGFFFPTPLQWLLFEGCKCDVLHQVGMNKIEGL